MGKSTAASLLSQRGVTVVDTDLLARQLVEPGQPALAEIQQAFGADMLAPEGALRRDLLARRVFSDPAARETLEAILHPRIRKLWQSQLAEWRSTTYVSPSLPTGEDRGEAIESNRSSIQSSPSPPLEERAGERRLLTRGYSNSTAMEGRDHRFFCVVIPLLFETHAETELDTSICLACSSATQHQRLLSRGWNAEQIAQRIKSQLPIEEKIARADYVIWNEGPLEVLSAQMERVLCSLAGPR